MQYYVGLSDGFLEGLRQASDLRVAPLVYGTFTIGKYLLQRANLSRTRGPIG